MRILHAVEFYPPAVGGAQEVVRQVSERLARQGHEVTVVTSALARPRTSSTQKGVRVVEFAVRGNLVRGLHGDVAAYQDFLRAGDFNVVMFYGAQQWTFDAALPALRDLRAAKVFAPCGFSGLASRRYRSYFMRMPGWLALFDRLLLHSETYQDAVFTREHSSVPADVIPNGADDDEFGTLANTRDDVRASLKVPSDAALLVTIGSHTGLKGHGEAISALGRMRRPAVLAIIGNRIGRLGCFRQCQARAVVFNRVHKHHRVVLLDLPRSEVVRVLRAGDLFVFPSRVECAPIVLMESLAAAVPFVATHSGNAAEVAARSRAGVILRESRWRHGRVRANPQELAQVVDGLLAAPGRLQAMGASGRSSWLAGFTWDSIAREYAQTYQRAIESRDRRP